MSNYKIEKYQQKLLESNNQEKDKIYKKKLEIYLIGGYKLQTPKLLRGTYKLNIDTSSKIQAIGYGLMKKLNPIQKLIFDRRTPEKYDVVVKILYAGVCRSDWHDMTDEWHAHYPLICGHEIAGMVVKIGPKVTKFKLNDRVAIGTFINSCRKCKRCLDGREQYCENGATFTYNGRERLLKDKEPTGPTTYGGFSNVIVVNENYIYKIPKNLNIEKFAPIMCAGVTTYSPLKQMGVNKDFKVGIAGIGGLGHVAIKLAKALGAYVVALTTSQWKLKDSIRLGANEAILMTKNIDNYSETLDLIINTIPVVHDIEPYLDLLKLDGTLWMLGVFDEIKVNLDNVSTYNRSIRGSVVAGSKETKELLELCSKHKIEPDVEIISPDYLSKTLDRLLKKDVKYRFVIDMT